MHKACVLLILVCGTTVGAYPLTVDNVVAFQEDTPRSEYVRIVREASPHWSGPNYHHHHHHHHHHHNGFGGGFGGVLLGGGLGGGLAGIGGGLGGIGGGLGGIGGGLGSIGGGLGGGIGGGLGGIGGGLGGIGGGFGGFGGGRDSSYANAGSVSTEIDTPLFDFRYMASNANAQSGGGGFFS